MVQISAALVQEAMKTQRRNRYPQCDFQVRLRPWQLVPFMCHPVLPGESLTNALIQARVVTEPIKSKLVGWWYEQFYFYVKIRDLAQRDTYITMFLEGASMSSLDTAAADIEFFEGKDAQPWAREAYKRIVEEWFRDQGEAWDSNKIGNYAVANVRQRTFLDSLIDETISPPTPNDLQDPEDTTVLSDYVEQYNRMVQLRFTDMSFEDWLEAQGVNGVETPEAETMYKPELLRHVSDWTYPTNTVEPTTGVPSSAAVWSMQERISKRRFFKEPGFIVGISLCRPKVYMSNIIGSAAGYLDEARLWLPQVFHNDPYTSLREFPDPTTLVAGPLGTTPTNGYWLDMRDLFLYGEQWRNFDIAAAGDGSHVALPSAALAHRYATATDADALFVGATTATRLIKTEGVVDLTIASPHVQGDFT